MDSVHEKTQFGSLGTHNSDVPKGKLAQGNMRKTALTSEFSDEL
jgi:hypothetical protein